LEEEEIKPPPPPPVFKKITFENGDTYEGYI